MRLSFRLLLRGLIAAWILGGWVSGAAAQTPLQPPQASPLKSSSQTLAQGTAREKPSQEKPSQETAQVSALDAEASHALDQIDGGLKDDETALQDQDISDADLQSLHDKMAPLVTELQTMLDHLNTRLAAVKVRLDQLGPSPAANAPPESALIGKERQQQQAEYAAIDALVKRAKLLLVQVQQTETRITARQRAKFAHSLFERSPSLADPDLWIHIVAETPHTLGIGEAAFAERVTTINGGLQGVRRPVFWLAVMAIVVLYGPLYVFVRRRFVLRSEGRSPLRKTMAAWLTALIVAGFPLLGLIALAGLLRGFGLFGTPSEAALWALARSVAYVSLAAGLAAGFLAPAQSNGPLLHLRAARCREVCRAMVLVALLIGLSHLVLALAEAVGAAPSYQAWLRGIAAFCVALALISVLWRAKGADCDSENIFGPVVSGARDWYGLLRSLLWIAAVAIMSAVVLGYMRLACFLADQLYWVGATGLIAFMLFMLVEEAIAAGCRPSAPFGRALMTSFGVRSNAIEQLAVLLSGAATVTIFIAAGLIVLAPWGVQSGDLSSTLRAAFFGFHVGDITVSIVALIVALGIFILGSMATHVVERWLDQRFLPQTRLDLGLRNAIKTSIGYLGFIVALSFALAYLGLNFEKLAIVAGALSVGIGFGLQSIVNNFVSGLILLWERAIRVGDWIVVGNDEGIVSRISVRATEIATFDRAAVLIPNSNLVTGIVKNFVRTDRSGRLQISIPVNAAADPETARHLLLDIAKAHPLVLEDPAPQVIFSGITASAFNFDLYCFIGDVAALGSVKSDLNFEIYRRFKAAGLFAAPLPESVVKLAGLENIEPLLNKLAAGDRLGNVNEIR